MAKNQRNPMMPLSLKDSEALEDIFEKVQVDEIRLIEATVAYYAAVPLEPWEEKGWIINSSLPNPNDQPTKSSNLN